IFDARRTGIVLLLQIEEYQVPAMAGGKTRDLEVIVEQLSGLRERVILPASEELFLVVVAWAPGKNTTHVQVLAQHLAIHILRRYTLARVFIVGPSGSMDVMVTRKPAILRRINPAF